MLGGLSKRIDGILREKRGKKKRFQREYVRTIISERFVFVDECSTNISLSPIYARAPRGERAHGKAPKNRGKNICLLCAIDSEGANSSMSVQGAVDSKAFESYIVHFLAPKLERGDRQTLSSQGFSSHSADRGQRPRALVPSALLSGREPHRGIATKMSSHVATLKGGAVTHHRPDYVHPPTG
jgi:hypothetical protein